MIELNNISKTFGMSQALKSVTLTLQAGKTTVLIGPSGCGKSTLLRLIIGLLEPDNGSVIFSGTPVVQKNVFSMRRKMGYVIQEGGLFPHLTARQNIILMARYLKWSVHSIKKRLDELLELTQFPRDGLERFPVQLSGGQQQRVSLMRALMLDPDVLLLDEPLGALDPMIRADLQTDLKGIFQRLKKTVVLVTHDIGEAGFFGDEIILFREGEIIQQGILEDLILSPADPFVTQFINAQRSSLETVKGDSI
ncbi:MAG: ATP-binding cassette domain-containing protein [Candidatus Desulfatibia sp.]|uniref:ATP-binding cassette domain-containing protein n=1 Tax=Candidatus Desulfatibia sp. TaxID=3101189 RepID=UPI002F32EF75